MQRAKVGRPPGAHTRVKNALSFRAVLHLLRHVSCSSCSHFAVCCIYLSKAPRTSLVTPTMMQARAFTPHIKAAFELHFLLADQFTCCATRQCLQYTISDVRCAYQLQRPFWPLIRGSAPLCQVWRRRVAVTPLRLRTPCL